MGVANIHVSETPLVLYTLRRADDALILGHRLSEWCGHAPMLEEDMALDNMGLDLLGQTADCFAELLDPPGQRLHLLGEPCLARFELTLGDLGRFQLGGHCFAPVSQRIR